MKTTVINLFGGPGSGKSTTAAAVFAELKLRGHNVELVTEYVKKLAWRGIQPDLYDQVYFFGKQAHSESILYGKVEAIVTDSPLLLSAFYEEHYQPDWNVVKPAVFRFIEKTVDHDVVRKNYWLRRYKPYNPAGRYQTEEEANAISTKMESWLVDNHIAYVNIHDQDVKRAAIIADLFEHERS